MSCVTLGSRLIASSKITGGREGGGGGTAVLSIISNTNNFAGFTMECPCGNFKLCVQEICPSLLPSPPPPSLHSRVIKTPMEVEVLRYTNQISSIAHCEVSRIRV